MGMYGTTDFAITCKDKRVANVVVRVLKNMPKDTHGNEFARNADLVIVPQAEDDEVQICGRMSSGRIQNLEFQVRKVWEAIKEMEGVIAIDAPFLVETEGVYESNEDI